ncbi:hypothetical protein AOLI_G00015270 [Acnodon oligacanthus]
MWALFYLPTRLPLHIHFRPKAYIYISVLKQCLCDQASSFPFHIITSREGDFIGISLFRRLVPNTTVLSMLPSHSLFLPLPLVFECQLAPWRTELQVVVVEIFPIKRDPQIKKNVTSLSGH